MGQAHKERGFQLIDHGAQLFGKAPLDELQDTLLDPLRYRSLPVGRYLILLLSPCHSSPMLYVGS